MESHKLQHCDLLYKILIPVVEEMCPLCVFVCMWVLRRPLLISLVSRGSGGGVGAESTVNGVNARANNE